MTERELRAVAEYEFDTKEYVIDPHPRERKCIERYDEAMKENCELKCQLATQSQYVKGLVEALKKARESVVIAINYSSLSPDKTRAYNQAAILNNIDETLQNLPEDLR